MDKIKKIIFLLSPLPFIGLPFLSSVGYFFGLHQNDSLRRIVTWGIMLILTILFGFYFLYLFKKRADMRKRIFFSMIIPFLYLILSTVAIIAARENRSHIFNGILTDLFFLTGIYFVTMCIWIEKKGMLFFDLSKKYAVAVATVSLCYILRFYLFPNIITPANLGNLDYMTLSYFFLVAEFMLLSSILYNHNSGNSNTKSFYNGYFFNGLLLIVFTIAIVLSGTRGAIVSAAIMQIAFLIYFIVIKCKAYKLGLVFCLTFLSMFLFSNVLSPENAGLTRLPVPTSVISPTPLPALSSTSPVENIISPSPHTPFATPIVEPTPEPSPEPSPEPVKDELTLLVEKGITATELSEISINLNDSNKIRTLLYKLSFSEFQKHLIIGNGSFSFQTQYGTYPHNIFLELAADFGLVGVFLLFIAAVFTIWILTKEAKTNKVVSIYLLLGITFAAKFMVSSSIYSYEFVYIYGSCLYIACMLWAKRRRSKQI